MPPSIILIHYDTLIDPKNNCRSLTLLPLMNIFEQFVAKSSPFISVFHPDSNQITPAASTIPAGANTKHANTRWRSEQIENAHWQCWSSEQGECKYPWILLCRAEELICTQKSTIQVEFSSFCTPPTQLATLVFYFFPQLKLPTLSTPFRTPNCSHLMQKRVSFHLSDKI